MILSNGGGITKEVKTGVDERPTKLSWSPDGRKIAFTAFAGGNNNLWLMESFLPTDDEEAKATSDLDGIVIKQNLDRSECR